MVVRMGDIRRWLQSLGLDQYADAFEESAISWSHLPDLDHDILKEIGVAAVGHRLTILKAVDDLAGHPVSSIGPGVGGYSSIR